MINLISTLTLLNSPIFFFTSFGFLSVERALISVPQLQIICYGVVRKWLWLRLLRKISTVVTLHG